MTSVSLRLHSRWREPRLSSRSWRGCRAVWVPATGRSQGLEDWLERTNFFPDRLRSLPLCSTRVLLPSCGGVEVAGFRRREQEAVRLSGHRLAFGQGGERWFSPGLENSSAVRKAPGKAGVGVGDAGLPATSHHLLPMCSAPCYWPERKGDAGAKANRLPRPLPGARTGAGSPGSNQPSGSNSAETFGFSRDGDQGRSGHTLTECGD